MDSNICRFCLRTGEIQSIFNLEDNHVQYLQKLMYLCGNIKIQPNDGFPWNICRKCIVKLNLSYEFKKQCENSFMNLTNRLKEIMPIQKESIHETSDDLIEMKPLENIGCSKFKNHKKVVENLECNTCYKILSSQSNLKRHMMFHSGLKPHRCLICGRSFGLAASLKTHMRIHTGEKPYRCLDCGSSFSQPGSLATHRRRHTGEHPFICDVCGGAFTSHGGLARHKRTHTGERRAQCSICGKKFTSVSYLNDHMRLHTGEKPYKCSKCSKVFASAANLSAHARIKEH